MAAEAIIGGTHVFQVIFIDQDTLQPIAVDSPTIDVFHYDTLGGRVDDVTGAAMTADVTEVGRYQYTFNIANTFHDGDTLYGYMTGIKPASTELAVAEQTLNLVSSTRATGGGVSSGCGMRAQFVKGG
jgi:hypothetical protein